MKNKCEKQKDKGQEAIQSLKIIYAFYCKLSKRSLKLKSFDDVTQKSEVMSLHELMTFCKNMQITAKQHKKADHNILSQFLDSKHVKVEKEENGAMKNNAEPGKKQKENNLQVIKEVILEAAKQIEVDQLQSNEFMHPHDPRQEGNLSAQKAVKPPQNYLNERKIAQIFKRFASQQGEIDFDTFITILKTIAGQMYAVSNTSNTLTKPQNTSPMKEGELTQENTNFADLLSFINLDTKEHILQTFIKINQFHGTMDHLALFRSPVKKLILKNDPLGKYAKNNENNKQNTSNSRSLLAKTEKTPDKLPRVVKTHLKKELLTYAKSEAKALKKDELQVFILANKSQIEHLNKSYLKNTINPINDAFNYRNLNLQPAFQPSGYSSPKCDKKYSQRHKDKVLGDIHHKQIGKLIDTSSLYDDAIFNKYLELNYKTNK